MTKLLRLAWGVVKPNTEWFVLLAVAGVGAWFYVQFAQVRADRDALAHSVELICAGAGADFAASSTREKDTKGRPVTVNHARGAVCQRTVRNLAAFQSETYAATARTLAESMQQHDDKSGVDAAHAARSADAARAATERMEKADAQIDQSDRVGAAWFDALNDVGGLRPPRR
ncbi:MAG: hypothetical protein V4475_01925 [Pseudomonadota bacterium]